MKKWLSRLGLILLGFILYPMVWNPLAFRYLPGYMEWYLSWYLQYLEWWFPNVQTFI